MLTGTNCRSVPGCLLAKSARYRGTTGVQSKSCLYWLVNSSQGAMYANGDAGASRSTHSKHAHPSEHLLKHCDSRNYPCTITHKKQHPMTWKILNRRPASCNFLYSNTLTHKQIFNEIYQEHELQIGETCFHYWVWAGDYYRGWSAIILAWDTTIPVCHATISSRL